MKYKLRRPLLRAAPELGLHYFLFATVVAYGGKWVKIQCKTKIDLESTQILRTKIPLDSTHILHAKSQLI